MLKKCALIWERVRQQRPLIHCITNYVTVNDVANIILAAGASPAMVEHPAEARDFAALAQALYVNLGTLTSEQELAMLEAVQGASLSQAPVIIDPVACGVIPRKVEVMEHLQSKGRINVIKGNQAEIKSLAGIAGQARGVDSLDSGEGLEEACRMLARQKKSVVAATGQFDFIADHDRLAMIKNGTPMFASITGAGCMVGGVVAACAAAAPEEIWLAVITAICGFNIAGERALRMGGDRPGSFKVLLMDNLFQLRGEDLIKEGKVNWLA